MIERDEVERSQRPDSISDLIGHRFWTKDKIEDPAETLCEAGLNSTDLGYQEYFRRLNHLATDLKKELEALKAGGGQVLQRHTRPTVFLAESTDDVDNLRTDLLEYLDQLDIPVLPQTLYDREAEAFRDAMTTDLSHSKLFVQLLSGLRGRKAPGGSAGYPRLQYDIARARGAEILQWRDQRLDVDGVPDEDQRKLLREVTVRAEGVEDFKRYIKQRLLEEPKPVVVPKQGLRAIVFVDSDKDDWDLAIAIRDRLKALGVDVSLPVWDQAPDEVRLDLEANLKQCHALIVVYGKSTVSWVRQQLLGLYRKAIAQREEPLQALAVYQGPPENKPALHIDIQNLRLIDSTNVPSNEVDAMLREFISQLQII